MHTQNVNVRTAAQESSRKIGGDLPPMRGLELRIQWGKARVMRVIDAGKAESEALDVLQEAMFEGHADFASGWHIPPHMFSDVPELVSAWHSGWEQAASFDETSHCACCQNDSGEPCPYHD